MQLFTRALTLAGPPSSTVPWATDMTQYVSAATGREVGLWAGSFGVPIGSVFFSMRVAGLADLDAVTQTLLADPAYHERIAAGAELVAGPAQDSLATPLYGELGDPPPVGAVATITEATMSGSYTAAIGWAIDVAQHVESLTGSPMLVLSQNYGAFGRVTWIGATASAADADAAAAKVAADTAYLEKLEAANGLFVPASGMTALLPRIA